MDSSIGRVSAASGPPRTGRVDNLLTGLAQPPGAHRAEPQDELWKLRACVSDLVSLLALPTLWRDGDAALVTGVLADVLLRMLKLDFVYARLNAPAGGLPVEVLRVGQDLLPVGADKLVPAQVGRALGPWLTPETPAFGTMVPSPLGGGETAIAFLWLGPDSASGVVVAGSRREGFPSYAETLLLRVAVNQAVVELQQHEVMAQRRRSAELEQGADRLRAENLWLRRAQDRTAQVDPLIGEGPAMLRVAGQVEQAAAGAGCVLIQGEAGTGRSLVARRIHQLSSRRDMPFVRLDCANIPPAQLDTELFGQSRSGVSGALARQLGGVELAHGGTLFLAGVGALPADMQARLLRLLQDQEFVPQGGSRPVRADVRVLAACGSGLADRVAAQEFRADLFERLGRCTIELPPVRECVEDIPLLVRHFMQQHARRCHKTVMSVAPATLEALCAYAWPGNVREIDNVIERSVMLSSGPVLRVPLADLAFGSDMGDVSNRPQDPAEPVAVAPLTTLDEAQREHILRALLASNWVIAGASGAAVKLGMKRTSLQYRMQKLGITRPV